jgi:hypothetical protein
MATRSIFKDVTITGARACRDLLSALENAESKRGKDIVLSQKAQTVRAGEIKKILQKTERT